MIATSLIYSSLRMIIQDFLHLSQFSLVLGTLLVLCCIKAFSLAHPCMSSEILTGVIKDLGNGVASYPESSMNSGLS